MNSRVARKILRQRRARDVLYVEAGQRLAVEPETPQVVGENQHAVVFEKPHRGPDQRHVIPLDVEAAVHALRGGEAR